jgi:hypothetical protein
MWEIQVKLATGKSVCNWKYCGSPITAFIHGTVSYFYLLIHKLQIRVAQGLSQPGVLSSLVKWIGNGFDQSLPSPTKFKN